MRHFINIVERASAIPDFTTFVTDKLINELVEMGTWTHHGSELPIWWVEGAGGYFKGEDESLKEQDFYEALEQDRQAVLSVLKRFVIARAGWIQRDITSGQSGYPVTADAPLHRAMMVNDQWLAALANPGSSPIALGLFWGLGHVEPWGANYEETKGVFPHMVEIVTKIRHVDIDWYETFRSRLDWSLGDDEGEIRLIPNSPIDHIERVTLEGSDTHPEMARASHSFPIHPSHKFKA
jgi:hypothetical protein